MGVTCIITLSTSGDDTNVWSVGLWDYVLVLAGARVPFTSRLRWLCPTSGILAQDMGRAFISVQEECGTTTPIAALGGDISPHSHMLPGLREMLS